MIKCKLIDKECRPIKAHTNDAGFDLKCRELVGLLPFQTVKVLVGVCIAVPEAYAGTIKPRSNISMKGILVHEGTVDCGYTGEISVIMTNLNNKPVVFEKYERIAQIVINKINSADVLVVVDELPETARGDNGFGSTGR